MAAGATTTSPSRPTPRRRLGITPWALVAFVAIVAVLHLLDPRDPWRRFVSEYGMEHPLLLGVAFGAWALAAVALVPSLWRLRGATGRGSGALLALFAALILVAAVFQIDGPTLAPPKTVEAVIHITAGRAAVAALALALCLAWAAARGRRAALTVLVVLVLAFGVPVIASPNAVGLTQRVLVGVEIGALALLAREIDDRRR